MSFKLFYYVRRFGYNLLLPEAFFKKKYQALKQFEKECNQDELHERLSYYFKINENFTLPQEAIVIKNFKRKEGTDYYLDLKDFLHFLHPETRLAYHFGDETHVNPYPTLFKARPIHGENANSILFKLNKNRHFRWVKDPYTFAEKKNMMVWRGTTYGRLRSDFVQKYWNHPLCDAGQTNNPSSNVPWQKNYLSLKEQIKYKFIFCPEGNDVSTNLKWAMSSNSLCFMPALKSETWFMEGTLQPGVHYVEINNDFSDLEEKILYYSDHNEEAEAIITNAHKHVERFQNPYLEDLLCLKVLENYVLKSEQTQALKFSEKI
ncbi:MAG: lipopolysaccharide A protein [Bacteroidia bacterium]|nr:MAG: lipopolysaccharide A protein [Bacteroidia bacterium]